jgi:hypothetical protein
MGLTVLDITLSPDTYKVARFFYRDGPLQLHPRDGCAHHRRRPTMRLDNKTDTFFKVYMFYTIVESLLVRRDGCPRFPRFILKDDSFSFTRAPPRCPNLECKASKIADMAWSSASLTEGSPRTDQLRLINSLSSQGGYV